MSVAEKKSVPGWPLAFFLLNFAAIAVWLAMTFATGDRELRIASMSPSGVDVAPDAVTEIRIDFNLPLAPESVDDDTVRLVPAVAGKTETAGDSAIRFVPRQPLRSATAYTVVLSPGLRGKRGEAPPPDLIEFATSRFRLESAEQVAFDRDSFTVELAFNQPIAASDLEEALHVESYPPVGDRTETLIRVQGNANASHHRLRIADAASRYLRVTLPAGLSGSTGPLGLEENSRLLWKIVGPERIDETKRPQWTREGDVLELKPEVAFLGMSAEWDSGAGAVRVRTTAPLDPARAREYVTVVPPLPVTFSSTWNGLKILGDFQPGKQYRITLRVGMPSGYAGNLAREVSRQVWFDDLPPSLAYSHGGGFLSPDGLLTVPVKTRNLESFTIGARKLYASNIVENLLRAYDEEVEEEYAESQALKKFTVAAARNKERETLVDLRAVVGETPLGVYGLELRSDAMRWARRDAMVAVTDLGLAARLGRERLLAWTTSIRDGRPRSGARVAVYSNKRQLLAEGVSGDDGVAVLDLPRLPDGETAALVLGEGGDGEYSFVRLERDLRPRPEAARQGSDYTKGYEAFISVDRGVYRGGEAVLLAGLVRDAEVRTVPDLPLELKMFGPDSRELRTMRVTADAAGRFETEAELGKSFPGGLYRIEAKIPGQKDGIGSAMFRIADYMPETLSIALELSEEAGDGRAAGDREHVLNVAVSRLAGGDLGAVSARAFVTYSPAPFTPELWRGWTFGDALRGRGKTEKRERAIALDDDGRGGSSWTDPDLGDYPAAARMTVRVEASENGERPAAAVMSKIVHQAPFYIGMHSDARAGMAGEAFAVDLAAVAPDGLLEERGGEWSAELFRVEHHGVMKRTADGRTVYEWVRRDIHEASLSGAWENGRAAVSPRPVAGGQYRLVVRTEGGAGCVYDFAVQGEGASWYGEDPETLEVTLDRDSYRVGDTAAVSVSSPFAGAALVTVETGDVLSHRLVDFAEGNNRVDVPVTEAMRPNAYLGVTLIRPAREEEEWRPHRLSGTALVRVDNGDRRLAVGLDAPDSLKPGVTAPVAVTVAMDGKPAAGVPVALWAVDVGVLSLTDHRTPSPWREFYRQRRAGVREADMYSRLAPELTAWRLTREAAPGGDAAAESDDLARRLNPIFAQRVRAAVLCRTNLTTDADGVAKTEFTIPEFAGRMRFMCWASADHLMGMAEKEVDIAAPVSIRAAWPRFAAPGDAFTVPLTITNRSGAKGVAVVSWTASEHLELHMESVEIELDDNRTARLDLSAAAVLAGVAEAAVTVAMGEDSFTQRVELSIRPPVLFARESGGATLEPGEKRIVIPGAGLLAANSRVKVLAGGSPMLSLSGSLDALLDYPYGCAEQTASRLLALTYLPDLLALSRPGQLESGEVSRLATACGERLASMQNVNGSLKMWPGADEELFWVSAQALFVLTESKAAGYAPPQGLIDNLARYLDSRLEDRLGDDDLAADGGESVALACLGLAKADRVKRSWLLRLEEIAASRTKQGRPLSSAALAFLSEAVAVAGDREAGLRLYERFHPGGSEAGVSQYPVMERAAWLMAAMTTGADAAAQDRLAAELAEMAKKGYSDWSTKENSLVLASLGRYWQKTGQEPDGTALLRFNGSVADIATRKGGSWDNLAAGSRIEAENRGDGKLRLFWMAEGIPLSGAAREEDRGLVARRRVFDNAGQEMVAPFELRQGEVYEIRLQVFGHDDNLALVDLLPAGVEIEDATLRGRPLDGDAAKGLNVRHVEKKDDRLLVFASLSGAGEYRYLARAVTAGIFAWPAFDASSMYDASLRSVHGRSELKVGGGKEVANDR